MGTNRILSLAIIAALTFAAPVWSQTLDQAEKLAVVTRAGELLTERYILPERAAQAKARIMQALASGAYDTITDPKEFALRLTTDLQSVTHDKHMRVLVNMPPAAPSAGASANRSYAGFMAVDRLKGNIGYIKLGALRPSIPSSRWRTRRWPIWPAPRP